MSGRLLFSSTMPVPNTVTSVPDLWSLAKDRLDEADRKLLDHSGGSGLDIVKDIQAKNEEAINESIKKRWRVVVPGRTGKTIIIRDLLEKITKWLNMFVKVGDAAMQYDPAHAALPWAGLRYLLQVKCLVVLAN